MFVIVYDDNHNELVDGPRIIPCRETADALKDRYMAFRNPWGRKMTVVPATFDRRTPDQIPPCA